MSEKEKLLALNLACLNAWYLLSQEERNNTDYDEFHADYLVKHGAAVPVTCRKCQYHPKDVDWGMCNVLCRQTHKDFYCSFGVLREECK